MPDCNSLRRKDRFAYTKYKMFVLQKINRKKERKKKTLNNVKGLNQEEHLHIKDEVLYKERLQVNFKNDKHPIEK